MTDIKLYEQWKDIQEQERTEYLSSFELIFNHLKNFVVLNYYYTNDKTINLGEIRLVDGAVTFIPDIKNYRQWWAYDCNPTDYEDFIYALDYGFDILENENKKEE